MRKIGKVLDTPIKAIFNGKNQNKLRIVALPFFFKAT